MIHDRPETVEERDDDRRPTVAVLVVNFRTAGSVERLLRSIAAHAGLARITVSVTDNSTDFGQLAELRAVADRLAGSFEAIRITDAETNSGYARGNNLAWGAIPEPRPDVVVVANPDVVVDRGSLAALADRVISGGTTVWSVCTFSDRRQGNGQSRLDPFTGMTRRARAQARQRSLQYVGGHFLAMSRETWEAAGGFAECYFLYCEELDLALRLHELGDKKGPMAMSDFAVTHVGGESTGHDARKASSIGTFHANRSRVILYRRHKRLCAYLPILICSRFAYVLTLAVRGRNQQARSVVAGLWSGLRSPVS
ncbi:glycosyltransferase family 2 protein [Plantibacter sp. T3]|uniref:glycosyltransferase family 2 protein n=1 Tax=Plantibacter sp. T3 TaxID=2653161 RepID=UPI0012EF9D13|nr:conserved hypothetical protein [Plantibacter sp. T3]